MIRCAARAAALLLVAPFLTFASALAPEHVHEPGPGHAHPTAHSHFAPHHVDIHTPDGIEIEHDIEHVVWISYGILHTTSYRTAHTPAAVLAGPRAIAPAFAWSTLPSDAVASAHGPPRATICPRGPPLPVLS